MTPGARALGSRQGNLFDAVPELLGEAGRSRASEPTAPAVPTREQDGQGDREVRGFTTPESPQSVRARLLNNARQRVLLLALAFIALALVALVQIVWLGLDGAGPSKRLGAGSLKPARAQITDRNGAPLAGAFPTYSLYFYPEAMSESGGSPLVRSPADLARELKSIFPDMDEATVEAQLASGKGGHLRERILPEEANAVFALGEVALQSPVRLVRHYPQGRLGAHVIGRVSDDGDTQYGQFGIEATQNERLSDPDLRAEPLELSIDVRVQGALEDEMGRGMRLANADGAAGVVLDVDTGEVIAMASFPDFNPNRLDQQDVPNTRNRVTFATYELGSVFKPLTVAAAIDAGVVRDLTRSWDASPIKAGGRTFKDYEEKGKSLTIPEALAYSSNTVTMRVAEKLGPERLRGVWLDLGMNRPVDIELVNVGKPIWPKGKWSALKTKVAAYGHGFNVTPLHLANAYAAMVNGGIFRPATLLKAEPGVSEKGTRVFKASTSQKMRQLLRLIAKHGTGRNANAAATGFRVGGKTGSAEKLVDGRYSKTRIVSTFAAAFPMDRPRYVVVVALDEPKITYATPARTAYWNAAPIVGNLIRRAGPMLDVRPHNTRDVDVSDLEHLLKDRS
ncbi:MAG: penicillin-binding protein 2 [Erythrobacter sp.]|uniref:peptidoglycan D,D-transpeptidase FtsI family protein n=1 Tax=Erythrobacter sp. TaxID=1042 RepID=UPI002604E2F7|nr:penicillin-binding protein 2 [Erythrobacter sp.]MDJ0979904.1 penicillin-binding protein 2 [Erythrobacter sp.]